MNQSDIFRLLLIILLLSNNAEQCENSSALGNINTLIITMLLMNPPDAKTAGETTF